MRFTDAIREGAKLKPQTLRYPEKGKSCVLQAAAEGAQILPPTDSVSLVDYQELAHRWPFLSIEEVFPCPVCGVWQQKSLMEICYHLNDKHQWTREAIADYIDTLKLEEANV